MLRHSLPPDVLRDQEWGLHAATSEGMRHPTSALQRDRPGKMERRKSSADLNRNRQIQHPHAVLHELAWVVALHAVTAED